MSDLHLGKTAHFRKNGIALPNGVIEKDLDLSLLRKELENVLAKMDIKYREVLILKFFEFKDYNEISDIIKKPIGTVGTLINRAKKQFKDILIKLDIKI